MRKYGIVVAIERELIAILKENKIHYVVLEQEPFKVYCFRLDQDTGVYVIHSNAGIVDAALATQMLIDRYHVSHVLNYGVVGALNPELKVGELLVVDRVVRHDIDFSFENVDIGIYPDIGTRYMDASSEVMEFCRDSEVRHVTLASGDAFINGKERKDYLRKTFDADICDMEGGAIARTCFRYNTPFFMVKCISDTYEGSNVDFEQNVVESGTKAFTFLLDMLEKMLESDMKG